MAKFHRQILDTQVFQGPRFIIELGTAASKLELGEGLLGASRLGHLQGVVLHRLAQGPAMESYTFVPTVFIEWYSMKTFDTWNVLITMTYSDNTKFCILDHTGSGLINSQICVPEQCSGPGLL